MNGNQIINMVIRMIMRRTIKGGLNAGMKRVSGGRGQQQSAPRAQHPQGQVMQSQAAPQPAALNQHEAKIQRKQAAKRAKQAARAAARDSQL